MVDFISGTTISSMISNRSTEFMSTTGAGGGGGGGGCRFSYGFDCVFGSVFVFSKGKNAGS